MVAVQNPEIREAVDTLYELSADKEARALYEHRLKMRLDRNSEIQDAKEEIARNLKALGIPIAKIAQGTGLTEMQIEAL